MRIVCILIVAIALASCGPSKETPKREKEQMDLYEADFRPSDYDQDPDSLFQAKQGTEEEKHDVDIVVPPESQLIQGFRVQLYSSSSIDSAIARKAEVESLFPGEWFYLVYDPPTYKIRAGNFQTRFDADRFSRLLAEKGYHEAWVVPEKIYRNPPPRPAGPEKSQTEQK